jgi:hypothetical protein
MQHARTSHTHSTQPLCSSQLNSSRSLNATLVCVCHSDDTRARLGALAELGLGLAIQFSTLSDVDDAQADHVAQHVASFKAQLNAAVLHEPELVLVCGGCDFWSSTDKVRFHRDAAAVVAAASAAASGSGWWANGRVCFSTGAGAALSHPAAALAVLESVPSTLISLDLGQWCAALGASATELTTCARWDRLRKAICGRVAAIASTVGSGDWPRLPHPTDDQVRLRSC